MLYCQLGEIHCTLVDLYLTSDDIEFQLFHITYTRAWNEENINIYICIYSLIYVYEYYRKAYQRHSYYQHFHYHIGVFIICSFIAEYHWYPINTSMVWVKFCMISEEMILMTTIYGKIMPSHYPRGTIPYTLNLQWVTHSPVLLLWIEWNWTNARKFQMAFLRLPEEMSQVISLLGTSGGDTLTHLPWTKWPPFRRRYSIVFS